MAMQRARTSAKPTKKLEASSPSITRPRAELRQKVDWGGTYIVPPDETVQRLLPGSKRPRAVRMDLRNFVPSHPSTVISAWVEARLEYDVRKHPWLEPLVHGMRRPASFDTVAHLVADAVFENIEYKSRDGATWQLPEETLARCQGDCEDRATLLAAGLVAAGISPYNVPVALGTIRLTRRGKPAGTRAHAWVVYRAEDGGWVSLEPVPKTGASKHADVGFEYEPKFVFNGDHRWSFVAQERPRPGERWNELDPTFHGEVHRSIVQLIASRRSPARKSPRTRPPGHRIVRPGHEPAHS